MAKKTTAQKKKIETPPVPEPHHHKFVWNWRMLILGILLNIAILSLVVYTVSLLNDYRQCTQGYLDAATKGGSFLTNTQPARDGSGSILNTNSGRSE